MPFRERQSAERLADHDVGIGDHGVETVEAMNSRFDGASDAVSSSRTSPSIANASPQTRRAIRYPQDR